MKARSKPTEKRERSVFSTIFISVLVILAVEVTLLIGSIAVSRVPQQLDRNAEDILAKQVENRSRYLEDFLVQAQNLGDMPNRINEKTEALLTSGQISKDTLGQSSASSEPLLEAIADDLVTQLRSSSVTGVFVVLNTCDLDARKDQWASAGHLSARSGPGCGGFRAQRGSDAVVCTGRNREVHAYFDGLLLAARAGL